MVVGEVIAKLRLDAAEFLGGLQQAQRAVQKHAEALRQAAAQAGELGVTLGAIGAAGLLLARNLVQAAGQMERYQAQFEVLTGSVEQAQDRLERLTHFAAATPFDLPGVIEADRMIQAFGLDVGGLEKTLRLFGDAAAGMGLSIQEVVPILAKLKAGMFEVEQMARLGITREALRKLGVEFTATGEVINREDLFPAAIKLLSRFSGMMDRTSRTVEGRLSNLRDSFFQLKAAIAEQALPALTGWIEKLTLVLSGVQKWVERNQQAAASVLLLGLKISAVLAAGGAFLLLISKLAGAVVALATALTSPVALAVILGTIATAIAGGLWAWNALEGAVRGVREEMERLKIAMSLGELGRFEKVVDAAVALAKARAELAKEAAEAREPWDAGGFQIAPGVPAQWTHLALAQAKVAEAEKKLAAAKDEARRAIAAEEAEAARRAAAEVARLKAALAAAKQQKVTALELAQAERDRLETALRLAETEEEYRKAERDYLTWAQREWPRWAARFRETGKAVYGEFAAQIREGMRQLQETSTALLTGWAGPIDVMITASTKAAEALRRQAEANLAFAATIPTMGLVGAQAISEWDREFQQFTDRVFASEAAVDAFAKQLEVLSYVIGINLAAAFEKFRADVEETVSEAKARVQQLARSMADAFGETIAQWMVYGGKFQDWWAQFCDALRRIFVEMLAQLVADWVARMARLPMPEGGGGEGGRPPWWLMIIPFLQHGGIITRPTIAVLAEAGPEAVVPLERGGAAMGVTLEAGAVQVNLDPASMDSLSIQRLADRLSEALGRSLERRLLVA